MRMWLASIISLGVGLVGGVRVEAQVILFASDFSSRLREFDSISFNAVDRGGFSPSFFAGGLDFRGNGQLYGISSTLRIINTTNAQNTQVGGSLPVQMSSLAFSPADQLYASSLSGNRLYRLDPNTGAVIGNFVNITGTGGSSVFGIDFDSLGTMYGVASDNLYVIDPATGAANVVASGIIPNSAPFTTGTLFVDIDIGPDDLLRGFIQPLTTGDVTVATLNRLTGALLNTNTVIGMTTQSGIASVPEPSAIVFCATGFGMVFVRRRMSKNRLSRVIHANTLAV